MYIPHAIGRHPRGPHECCQKTWAPRCLCWSVFSCLSMGPGWFGAVWCEDMGPSKSIRICALGFSVRFRSRVGGLGVKLSFSYQVSESVHKDYVVPSHAFTYPKTLSPSCRTERSEAVCAKDACAISSSRCFQARGGWTDQEDLLSLLCFGALLDPSINPRTQETLHLKP